MQENLRVHAVTPGAEPRISNENHNVVINGKTMTIPAGTGISCQPYSIHRVEYVFPGPNPWLPEKWHPNGGELDAAYIIHPKSMQRHMMVFGKGIRMCL